MNILDRLQKLKDYFTASKADDQDVHTIDAWISEAKRLLILQSLANHDGIKYVINIFKSEVEKINESLNKSYSKDLPDRDRDRLLDKRDLAQKYLNLFLPIEDSIKMLEEAVDREEIKN